MNKLYEKQSYLKENTTTVLTCENTSDGIFITLQDTIFFPEEGGQYADTGTLILEDTKEEIKLIDGIYIDSDNIKYKVDKPVTPGSTICCHLDWDKRFARMQNHSGEHILTGLIHNTYGYNNVGFHLSDDGPVTLNMDGMLTIEQIRELEYKANAVIYDNLPITDSYPSKEELPSISYRSKIDIQGQVRLITVGNPDNPLDVCACCAPHVARTGEIGIIKVIYATKFKGGIQIGILCGKRALEYINHEQDTLSRVASLLTTHADNVPGIVEAHMSEIAHLKAELSALREKQLTDCIMHMSKQDPHCIFTDSDLSVANMKNLFNALAERFEGYVGVFVGNDTEGYRYYAGSSNLDSRDLATSMREKLGAKGGGNSDMIQGRVEANSESISQLFLLP